MAGAEVRSRETGSVPAPRLASYIGGTLMMLVIGCLPRTTPAPDPATDETWVFSCADGFEFSARSLPGIVSLRLPLRTTALPRVRSESGLRYAADGSELLRTGATATLRVDGELHTGCNGQRAETGWDEARLLGAEFRAVGVEPGWSLEIDGNRQMRFLLEGSSEVVAAAPEPTRTDGAIAYRAESAGHEIDVTIREEACENASLGTGLTHSVELRVDGFPYTGCGRMLGSVPAAD